MLTPEIIHQLKTASQFDVHRWSDYAEVNEVVNYIFDEICTYRKSKSIRVREKHKVWRHLKSVIIDLFAAYQLGFNPYRGISLRKNDYQKETRYRRIHLKYDYLIGVLRDLEDLEYIEIHKGYFDHSGRGGKRSRIKVSKKLIDLILGNQFNVKPLIERVGVVRVLSRSNEDEPIILRDADGKLLDYEDNPATIQMRQNIEQINAWLKRAHIVLDINDEQAVELSKIFNQEDRVPIDFSRTSLHRVFNDPSFRLGGRFYGGWWESLPSRFRKYIRINHKPTVELDYSGHHIRILYSKEDIEAAKDLYAVEGCPFSREHLKLAALIVVNAQSKTSALRALNDKKLGIETKVLLELIESHFAPISKYFYSNVGLELQYIDSLVCERVMFRMKELGAVVLPIHDSFVVRNSYEEELWSVMLEEYARAFGTPTFLKRDTTVLDDKNGNEETGTNMLQFVTDDLEELLTHKNKTWFRNVFGIEG